MLSSIRISFIFDYFILCCIHTQVVASHSKCYNVWRCKDFITLELRSTTEFFCFWDIKYSLARKPPRLRYMRYRICYRGLVYPSIVIQLKPAVVEYDLSIPHIYAATLCGTVNPNICSPYRVTFHSPPKLYNSRRVPTSYHCQ